jgi:CDP-diacylglycerol--glycerol-3-phosphate 3-phosphatidyltransferase
MSRRLRFYFVTMLTFARVPLVFLFLIGAATNTISEHTWLFALSLAALVLAALTDLVDGYYARKLEVTTQFGAYADPLTDKIYYLTTLPLLIFVASTNHHTAHSLALLCLTVMFLLRDQWVSFLRSIGSTYGLDAKANWSGKLRTALAFPVICVAYIIEGRGITGWPMTVLYVMEAAAIAVNVISMWVYTVYYLPCLKKAIEPGSGE